MASHSPDDIAELKALLARCCSDLAGLSDEAFVASVEGEVPRGVSANALVEGELGPRWRPLIVGLPPGVSEMVSILEPPVKAITTLLQILSTLLDILKKLLIGITDPFEALIAAAIDALEAIITDLLNAGGYLYYDAPGLTSPEVALGELGLDFSPKQVFHAGKEGEDQPLAPVDNFARWAGRFGASFDDPGDLARPTAPVPLGEEPPETPGGPQVTVQANAQPFSTGGTIEAVFIVATAPSLADLARLVWLLGNLLNIDAFKRALDRFTEGSEDQALSRVAQRSVAPDWHSKKLHELIPELRELAKIPAILRGLLSKVASVIDLLTDLIDAIQGKVTALLEIAQTIQDIIDMLSSLQSAGLYTLPVSTNEGVDGLKRAFIEASNRPEGGFVAGACLLAAGPGLKDAAFLWEIFAGGEFARVGGEALGALEQAGEEVDELGAAAEKSMQELKAEMEKAIDDLPESIVASLGRSKEELLEALTNSPQELYEILRDAKDVQVGHALREGQKRAEELAGREARSLALLSESLDESAEKFDEP